MRKNCDKTATLKQGTQMSITKTRKQKAYIDYGMYETYIVHIGNKQNMFNPKVLSFKKTTSLMFCDQLLIMWLQNNKHKYSIVYSDTVALMFNE